MRPDKPITSSLLDTDFYKFAMGQLIFLLWRLVPVEYHFINRSKTIRIADSIDVGQLKEELDHARTLRFNKSELHYLRGTNEYGERMFCEEYLTFLEHLKLPEYELRVRDGQIDLALAGPWSTATYWEMPALPIIQELLGRAQMKHMTRLEKEAVYAQGTTRLLEKIRKFREHPGLRFSEFGTRRRFSFDWQMYVDERLAEELPRQFLGTSNVLSAMRFGLMLMGTSAHELPMILAGTDSTEESIRSAQRNVYDAWWKQYGFGLSIALPDAFGSAHGLEVMGEEHLAQWKGTRQDSGDPHVYIRDQLLPRCRGLGIDARTKMVIPSDALTTELATELYLAYREEIGISFGIGTHFTNDMGFKTPSIVIKPAYANGHPLVKLSDNVQKATGEAEEIERYKKIFGYHETADEECRC